MLKEEKIKKYMHLFKVSYDEAKKMVEDDEIIDKGGKADWEVELTPEQKKAQRKLLRADTKPSKPKAKREKVVNNDKLAIIDTIVNALEGNLEATNIVKENEEREITFIYNDVKYKVTLQVPRVPKG